MDSRPFPRLYSGYVGSHLPTETHSEHVWRSEAKANPEPIPETKITKAFGSWTLPVLVEQCEDPNLDIRQNAMKVLCDLLQTPKRVVEALGAGVVEALSRLVDDTDVRMSVSQAFVLVARNASGKAALAATITSLLPLLDDEALRVREHAYEALLCVCSTCDGLQSVVGGGYVAVLCAKARSEDARIQPQCLLCLYHCLKDPSLDGPRQALDESAVGICISLLDHEFHLARFRAAENLTLLCFSAEAKRSAIDGGAVDRLVGLLADTSPRVRAAAAGGLMTICTEDDAKFLAIEAGAVDKLAGLLGDDNDLVKLNAVKAMSCIVAHPDGRAAMRNEACLGALDAVRTYGAEPDARGVQAMLQKAADVAIRLINWNP